MIDLFKVSRTLTAKIRESLVLKNFANITEDLVEMKIQRKIDGAIALLL